MTKTLTNSSLVARTMAGAGAVLLALSILPGLARADETAAPTVILDPMSGSLATPVRVKASGPCPEGSTGYSLVMLGTNAPGGLYTSETIAPDLIPDTASGPVPALPLFDTDNPPVDGEEYTLHVVCILGDGSTHPLTSIILQVTGTHWEADAPVTSEPPTGTTTSSTSQPPTSEPPTSQPPTGNASATVNPASAAPGALIQVTVAGFGVQEEVARELRPTAGGAAIPRPPQSSGPTGTSTAPLQLPADIAPGAYKLVLKGGDTGRTAEVALTVTGPTTPPTSEPPTSQPPTSEPPTSEPPTETPTETGTGTPTETATTPGTANGGSDGGSSGSGGSSGGGGLAHTGALTDPRLIGSFGAALMAGSGAVWYRVRRRSALLEADGQQ